MCFSSLVLSRRPKTLKKRTQTLKNPLTPIGSCRDLHIQQACPLQCWGWHGVVMGLPWVKKALRSVFFFEKLRNSDVLGCKSRPEPIGVRGF